MKKIKHIEVVRSALTELSSMSQESANAIFQVLVKNYTNVRISLVNNLADLESVVARNPDLVFLGMKFIKVSPTSGESSSNKIWVTDYLDDHNIAYTGSSQLAHEIERNKALAKQRVKQAGLDTAQFCVIKQGQLPIKRFVSLEFPMFVKPANRGCGVGIDSDSVIFNFKQLISKISKISSYLLDDSLIEEYLPGREFSVAILRQRDSSELSAMPIELIAPKNENNLRILSESVKSSNTERVISVIDNVMKNRITTLALDAFYALGARDYGRVDIRLDKRNVPHFLEANLIPSLISDYGSFPKACLLNDDLDYESMIIRITELGLKRSMHDADPELLVSKSDSVALAI